MRLAKQADVRVAGVSWQETSAQATMGRAQDINEPLGNLPYKAFLELVPHLVREQGRIVALLPGAWSSDLGTRHLRDLYLEFTQIEQWTSLENRRGYFPIDCRYKFGILAARRDPWGTRTLPLFDRLENLQVTRVRFRPPRPVAALRQ